MQNYGWGIGLILGVLIGTFMFSTDSSSFATAAVGMGLGIILAAGFNRVVAAIKEQTDFLAGEEESEEEELEEV